MTNMESKVLEIVKVEIDELACRNSILRVKSKPIHEIDSSILEVVEVMKRNIYSTRYGTGLSAVQLGLPIRLAVVNLSRAPGSELVLANPRITRFSGRWRVRQEGCLSLPGYKGAVRRKDRIVVEALDLDLRSFTYESKGYEAAVIQHEIDHLDGVLYWDRMEDGLIPAPVGN